MASIGRTPRVAVATEDVRHLQLRRRKMSATSSFGFDMAGGSGRRRFDVQLFEWALNLSDRIHRDAGIAGRRIDVAMAKQSLNDANVDLLFQQMRREAVSQRVHGDILSRPAASAASWKTRCSDRVVIGCKGSGPGKSQWVGLVRFQ